MGYKIGQMTKGLIDYSTSVASSISTVNIKNLYNLEDFSGLYTFTEICMTGNFLPSNIYNIKYTIEQPTSDRFSKGVTLDVFLADDNMTFIQDISRINIPRATTANILTAGTLFLAPIKRGTKIIFKMVRGITDFSELGQRNWTTLFSTSSCYRLNNIMNENQIFKRIGFQSRPGTQIVINNVPIKVGRSGIFELNAGIDITSFMVAENNNGQIDPFILDYTYITS